MCLLCTGVTARTPPPHPHQHAQDSKSFVMGLSATPVRLDPDVSLAAVFQALVQGPSVSDLIRKGVLVKPTVYAMDQVGSPGSWERLLASFPTKRRALTADHCCTRRGMATGRRVCGAEEGTGSAPGTSARNCSGGVGVRRQGAWGGVCNK